MTLMEDSEDDLVDGLMADPDSDENLVDGLMERLGAAEELILLAAKGVPGDGQFAAKLAEYNQCWGVGLDPEDAGAGDGHGDDHA